MTALYYTGAIEECSELIKIICKVERFGIDYPHPTTGVVNRDALIEELGDVVGHCAMLADHLGIPREVITDRAHKKMKKFKKRHNL